MNFVDRIKDFFLLVVYFKVLLKTDFYKYSS